LNIKLKSCQPEFIAKNAALKKSFSAAFLFGGVLFLPLSYLKPIDHFNCRRF